MSEEKQMSPAEREARQMMAEKKMQEAATKAYDKASTTPPAPAKKMAKGGSVSARADGVAQRGKTRGKMC